MITSRTYVFIPASGELPTVFTVTPENESKELSGRVGGYIERVHAWGNHNVIVNETGLLDGLPVNRVAMFLTSRFGQPTPLVGDAVLVGFVDDSGEFQSVSATMIELAQRVAISDSALINPARYHLIGGAK